MFNKRILALISILGMAISTVPFFVPEKEDEIVGPTTYREEIYDKGVKPVKLIPFEYNDYSQSPTGDTYYNTQKNYHLNSMEIGSTWNNYRGDGITVAVIDTGVNYSHEDFVYYNGSGTSISNKSACFTDANATGTATRTTVLSDGWSVIQDTHGHGTNVASTVASRINGVGCVGVAPNVELMFLRAPNLMSSEVSAAIRYAADNGANIISMSIGMYASSFTSPYTGKTVTYASNAASLFSSAINYAHGKGCIIFAAAGNDNTNELSYPACNNYVIGVGALAQNSRSEKAAYSNFNKSNATSSGNNNVDVTVVGSVYVAGKDSNSHYKSTAGTSFACPATAAAMALYLQSHTSWTIDSATQALYDSCDDIGDSGWDTTFGYGAVSVSQLVDISYDVSGISLNKQYLSLYENSDSSTLIATVTPSYATNKNISWTISDSTIADLSSNSSTSGNSITVTAKKAGTATITATSSQGGYTATCNLTVSNYISSEFTVSPSSLSMVIDDKTQINHTWTNGTPSFDELNYESSNTNVATVSSSGLVTAIGAGTCNITVSSIDDQKVIPVTVSSDLPHEWVLVNSTSDLNVGEKYIFANQTASKVCGGRGNNAYLSAVDATFSQDKSSITELGDGAEFFTLGGSSGAWTFSYGSTGGLLYYSGDSFATSGSSTYTIAFSGDNATIKGGSNAIQYNSSSPRFKIYSSSQQPIQLYKKVYSDVTKTLDHISLSNQTTTYYVGDTFTFDGICTAYWVGETIGTISSTVTPTTVSEPDMTTSGTKQITVTYTDSFGSASANYNIVVEAVTLVSISYTGPTKTTYTEGETFSTAGLVVTAHYSYSARDKVVATYVVDTSTLLTTSDVSWQISYTESGVTVYANIGITVNEYIEPDPDTSITLSIYFNNSNTSYTETTKNTTWSATGTATGGSYLQMKSTSTYISNSPALKVDTSKAISFTAKLRTYGGSNSQKLSVAGYNSNGVIVTNTLELSPSNSTLTNYSGTLTFTSTSDKSITIKAYSVNVDGAKNLGISEMSVEYTPYPDLNGVSLDKNNLSLDVYNNPSSQLTATIDQDAGVSSTLSWTSSNESVATVSNSGLVTAIGVGNATITVTATHDTTVKTATCSVTVTNSTPIPVTGISLDKNELNLNTNGESASLTVVYEPFNANQLTTTWTSSNESVATISGSGATISVVPHAKGNATITATCNGHSATCSVTVSDVLVASLSLDKTSNTIASTSSFTLTASITPNNATNPSLTWSTSSSSVACISSTSGSSITVTGGNSGVATITVSTNDDSDLSATCTVTVIDQVVVTSIELTGYTNSVAFKNTYSVGVPTVTAHYSDNHSSVVTPTTTNYAVDTSVLGNHEISCSYTEGGVTVNATGIVKVTNNGADVGNSSSQPASITGTFTGNEAVTTGGLTFTPGGTRQGYDANRGIQWSKNAASVTVTGLSSSYTVTSIVVTCSANCSGTMMSVKVNNVSFGSNYSVSSSNNQTPTFSGSASGATILVSITTGSKSTYIKSIQVNYTQTVSHKATPTEQASAWATYFLSLVKPNCDNSGVNSNVSGIASNWSELKTEYNYMVNDAKDAFVNNNTDASIIEARTLYMLIYFKYHNSFNNDNFVVDSSSNTITNVTRPIIVESFNSDALLIMLISALTLTISISFVFYLRRRKQK